MRCRQAVDQRFTACGEPDENASLVGGGRFASHELSSNEAVNQSHGAVVPEVKTLREISNGNSLRVGEALNREQRLMLLRREAGVVGCLTAEVEKTPQS